MRPDFLPLRMLVWVMVLILCQLPIPYMHDHCGVGSELPNANLAQSHTNLDDDLSEGRHFHLLWLGNGADRDSDQDQNDKPNPVDDFFVDMDAEPDFGEEFSHENTWLFSVVFDRRIESRNFKPSLDGVSGNLSASFASGNQWRVFLQIHIV